MKQPSVRDHSDSKVGSRQSGFWLKEKETREDAPAKITLFYDYELWRY